MVELPTMLGRSVRTYLNDYYRSNNIPEPEEVKNFYDKNTKFLESELDLVKSINVDEQALPYLDYFSNVNSISFYGNGVAPYIHEVINSHPNLVSLGINNISNLSSLNISSLANLQNLNISSTNINRLIGLEKIQDINSISFVDNPLFSQMDIMKQLVANNFEKMENCNFDILFYPEIMEALATKIDESNASKITFSEMINVGKEQPLDYDLKESIEIYNAINNIVKNYINQNDTPEQRYAIIHEWMCENVGYTTTSDKVNGQQGCYNALVKGESICQGYTKAMIVLLKSVGIKAFDVECVQERQGVHTIGETQQGVLGDHSILKVNLGNMQLYYSDVTWDAELYQHGQPSKWFLLSKEDISLDHSLVGQDMVITSPSKSNEEKNELLRYASERIRNVNKQIKATEKQLNGTDEEKKQFESENKENYYNENETIKKMKEVRKMVEDISQHPEQVEHSNRRIM